MLPPGYEKKSFIRFAVPIDLGRLRNEYSSIPPEAWARSYWGNIHCSVGMLLLRGGSSGTEEDFFCDEVTDNEHLASMPYISSLLDKQGPFGGASYAFLFRMIPNGVSLKHQDLMEQWFDLYRIHVPVITNSEAFLIADERSMHFAEGYAWSFDNQSDHGVVNGPNERIHLIFDVPFNSVLKARLDEADILTGERVERHVQTINSSARVAKSYPGDRTLKDAVVTLRERGHTDEAIAAFFNQKQIPSKYLAKHSPWSAQDIRELMAF